MTPTPDAVPIGSRDRVLALLRTARGPLGVGALMTATGLSSNAVRFHLDRLVRSGAARAATDRRHTGPGRPAILYSATPAAAVDPAAAYRLLAGILAGGLARTGRRSAATEAGRTWARTTATCAAEAVSDPVTATLTLLTDTGFQPVLRDDGRTIELHRCPYLDLAVEQPEVVCGIHLGMVRGVLEEIGDTSTVRLVAVLDSDGPCIVKLAGPSGGPQHSRQEEEQVP